MSEDMQTSPVYYMYILKENVVTTHTLDGQCMSVLLDGAGKKFLLIRVYSVNFNIAGHKHKKGRTSFNRTVNTNTFLRLQYKACLH